MTDSKRALSELHAQLGYKRLSRTWAKLEILFGLLAGGAGLLLSDWTISRNAAEVEWSMAAGGLALFVLGGYLAMAGHRSHLYRSGNERTAYLAELIRSMNDKGKRE
jgi:uncharacterized membrane protein YGL010W